MAELPPSYDKQLFVRGLANGTNETDLKETFSKFGNVTEVIIPRYIETNRPKGYAFVSFENLSDFKEACRKMDGKEFRGMTLNVEPAIPKDTSFHLRRNRAQPSTVQRFNNWSRGRSEHGFSDHGSFPRYFGGNRVSFGRYLQDNTRYSSRFMLDVFHARRSPMMRSCGCGDCSLDERHCDCEHCGSQVEYRDDRPSRGHYCQRRMRLSPPGDYERYYTRSGGRRKPTHVESSHFTSDDGSSHDLPFESLHGDRSGDDFEQKYFRQRSPSPPLKGMRTEKHRCEIPQKLSQHDSFEDSVHISRSRATMMKRRMASPCHQSKKVRMDEVLYTQCVPEQRRAF